MKLKKMPQSVGGIPPVRQGTAQAMPVKATKSPPQYTGSRSEAAGRLMRKKGY